MCTILDADHILAHMFRAGSDTVSISQLKSIRREVEGSYPGLFLDIDTESLMYAVKKWSDYFEWQENDSGSFIRCLRNISSEDMKMYWYMGIPDTLDNVISRYVGTR